jgi:hypothetical protein
MDPRPPRPFSILFFFLKSPDRTRVRVPYERFRRSLGACVRLGQRARAETTPCAPQRIAGRSKTASAAAHRGRRRHEHAAAGTLSPRSQAGAAVAAGAAASSPVPQGAGQIAGFLSASFGDQAARQAPIPAWPRRWLRRPRASAIPCTVGTRCSAARCNGTGRQVAGVFDGKEMLSQVFGSADDDWDPSALDDPAAPTLSGKGPRRAQQETRQGTPYPAGGLRWCHFRPCPLDVPPRSPLA